MQTPRPFAPPHSPRPASGLFDEPIPDPHYQTTRAALAAAETTGDGGEEQVRDLLADAGRQYFLGGHLGQHPSTIVRLHPDVRYLRGARTRKYDGYLPEYHAWTEVRSGKGKETDSMDKKIIADVYDFILGGIGDVVDVDAGLVPCGVAPELWIILTGTKAHSGYMRVLAESLAMFRRGIEPTRQEPIPVVWQERASRILLVRAHELADQQWLTRQFQRRHQQIREAQGRVPSASA